MTDMKARIEKAARAINPGAWAELSPRASLAAKARRQTSRKASLRYAEAALRAALPQLFTDPPSHWIAPMEATDEMDEAGHSDIEDSLCGDRCGVDDGAAKLAFASMRTAYLNQKDSE